jgi:hypothetical protein
MELKLKDLKSIKGWVIFFGILSILYLIVGILTMQNKIHRNLETEDMCHLLGIYLDIIINTLDNLARLLLAPR